MQDMAYTTGFDYDIFISFSHEDNKPRPGGRGWIEQFREYLEWWLTSRRGLKGLRIWWDKERLGGNTDFDERIERDLGNTALFFVVHSRNYRDSDYCAKELDWFVDKAKHHSVGLSVNGERRIFNIQINKIPHTDWTDSGHWTEPLAGTVGFRFYDGEKPEDYGDPIEPEDHKRFDEAMRRIVDAATRLVKSFPETKAHPADQPSSTSGSPVDVPTLFVADVSEGLAKLRKRLIREIGERARVLEPVPPPYPEAEHDAALRAALAQADLTIHLLGQGPGREIDDTEVSYPQRQADLAAKSDAPSLLWLPETVRTDSIEDEDYRDWVKSIEDASRTGDGYQFLRGTKEGLIDDVMDQIARFVPDHDDNTTGSRTFLIDPHGADQHYGFELAADLTREHPDLRVRVTSDADKPADSWDEFDALVRQAQDLIVLFGRVAPEWVKGRVERAIKVAANQIGEQISLETIWLLLLPECPGKQALPSLPKFIRIELLDNRGSLSIAEETVHRLMPEVARGHGS